MTANSQLLTTTPKTKTKLSKQLEQKQNHRNGESHGGLSIGDWEGARGGKGTENK